MVSAIKVEISEMKHAFRVNGVTFSRKKLAELFPIWGNNEETFYRYLTIVPFLADTREPEDTATPLGYYAVYKAKRIMEALKLPESAGFMAVSAFMEMAANMGNLPITELNKVSDCLHDNVCTCGKKKGYGSALDKKALH